MTNVHIPGQNVPISIGGTPVDPVWYDFLRFVETLQPLSDIEFPVPEEGVTSIDGTTGDFTLGYGLARAAQALSASFTSISAVLGSNVSLNNTANYFDGPSVAQGTTGTWFASGTITLHNPSGAGITLYAKLWDGTNVVASASITMFAGEKNTIALSGTITSPAGNLRISARDVTNTSGLILSNDSGNSKDSHITAVRIG